MIRQWAQVIYNVLQGYVAAVNFLAHLDWILQLIRAIKKQLGLICDTMPLTLGHACACQVVHTSTLYLCPKRLWGALCVKIQYPGDLGMCI